MLMTIFARQKRRQAVPFQVCEADRRTQFTEKDGAYELTTIKPVTYLIPDDVPVGQMLSHAFSFHRRR